MFSFPASTNDGHEADTQIDSHMLMDLPEVYHYGRRGTWFGLTSFFMYMLDGVVSVSFYPYVVDLFLRLALIVCYQMPTMRKDGYGTYLYE